MYRSTPIIYFKEKVMSTIINKYVKKRKIN